MSEEVTQPKGTKVGVGIHNLSVALRFDNPTQMVTFTPEQASQLGRQLIKTSRKTIKLISQHKRELAKKMAEK